MTYTPKLNWVSADGVSVTDLIRIEQGIKDTETLANDANNILAKIKTVDGAGSGLDTDTVRGKTALVSDGTVPMTGPLVMPYGGQIKFKDNAGNDQDVINHYTGNTVQIGSSSYQNVINYAGNAFWHDGRLRNNSGVLEFYDSATWKAVGGVKSVQRGVVSAGVSTDVTVTSVNTAKSYIVLSSSASDATGSVKYQAELISGTTIRFTNTGSLYPHNVAWQLIESY